MFFSHVLIKAFWLQIYPFHHLLIGVCVIYCHYTLWTERGEVCCTEPLVIITEGAAGSVEFIQLVESSVSVDNRYFLHLFVNLEGGCSCC